jgi:hypothetical protein
MGGRARLAVPAAFSLELLEVPPGRGLTLADGTRQLAELVLRLHVGHGSRLGDQVHPRQLESDNRVLVDWVVRHLSLAGESVRKRYGGEYLGQVPLDGLAPPILKILDPLVQV